MEAIVAYYECDLTKPVRTVQYEGQLFTGDDGANIFEAEIRNGGEYVRITENVKGLVYRSDGEMIEVEGTAEANLAIVKLTGPCYEKEGEIRIQIKVGGTTVINVETCVYSTSTSNIIEDNKEL